MLMEIGFNGDQWSACDGLMEIDVDGDQFCGLTEIGVDGVLVMVLRG